MDKRERDYSIDFVKGVAILFVILLHNMPNESIYSIAYIGQAVPLFLGNYIQSYSITLVKRCKDLLSHIGRIFPYKNVFLSVSLTQQLTNHEL